MSAPASAGMDRVRAAYRAGLTLLVAAALYEAIARSGWFPPALLPTLPKIARTLWTLLLDGTMLEHAGALFDAHAADGTLAMPYVAECFRAIRL